MARFKIAVQRLLGVAGYRLDHIERAPQGDLRGFMQALKKRGFSPASIIDIGANDAGWSGTVAKVFPNARYLLVEPQAEMKPRLDKFCRDVAAAEYVIAGADSEVGSRIFTMFPDTVSSTFSLPEATGAGGVNGGIQRKVELTTIDALCKARGNWVPEVIKIDAEGFDFKILQGAASVLGKTELILLELTFFGRHEGALSPEDLIQFMKSKGYSIYDFTGFQRRPYDGAMGQLEVAFALDSGRLRSNPRW